MRPHALAAILAALLAASAPDVRAGSAVDVRLHFPDAALRRDAEGIAARARGAAVRAWGGSPERVGAVHVHRTWADWAAVERRLTGGEFAAQGAFTSRATGDAHIALQPPLEDVVLERIGLPQLTRRLIAHETAHVVVHGMSAAPERHPSWLAEGVACVVADEALGVVDVAADPMASTRAARCRGLLEEGRLPHLLDVVDDRLAGLSLEERYAVWWSVVSHLAKARPAALASASRAADLGAAAVAAVVREALGDDADAADNAWARSLEALRPEWDEERRSLGSSDGRLVHVAFDEEAVAWRAASHLPNAWTVSGEVELLAGRPGRAGVLVDLGDDVLEIGMEAGFGLAVLRRSRRDGGAEEPVVTVPIEGFGRGVRRKLCVAADGRGRMDVRVGRRRVAQVVLEDPPRRVGLFVAAGSAALWERWRGP